jgi:CubicO group peptidase (beta-lactamase class C family)
LILMNAIHRWVLPVIILPFLFFVTPVANAQMSLNSFLQPYLSLFELPAFAAAVVKEGKVVTAGAVGTRRIGTKIAVKLTDRFHLGSDTKAMTALLAAMAVEEGKLRWNSTLADIFPELAEQIDPRLRSVTLEQFLSHMSGLPTDNEEVFNAYAEAMSQEGNLDKMRYWLLGKWSKRPLASEPGTNFAYSNMGYIFVGTMVERASKKTWDELMTERIFNPLQLRTAGLGSQSSLGKIDAPVGHAFIDGEIKSFLAGPNGDGPVIMGPAGMAHMSILDFARWAGWNAGQGKRGPALVQPEILRKLHTPVVTMPPQRTAAPGTPPGGRYALGWGKLDVEWAPRALTYHGGSNSMNLAKIWIDTTMDFAMVLATNIGGQKADEGLTAAARALYEKYSGK